MHRIPGGRPTSRGVDSGPSIAFLPGHALLRGILATVVFLGHAQFASLWPEQPQVREWYERLLFWNNQAVDIFFVLSGFILFHVYPLESVFRWTAFASSRIARIYPLFMATTALALALFGSLAAAGFASVYAFSPSSAHAPFLTTWPPLVILGNFLGVQQWTTRGDIHNSINFPAWSVSVELLLYGTTYPIFRTMFRRGWIGPRSALIFCVLTLACNACYQMTGDSLQAFDLLVRGLTGFAGGAFLYRAISGGKDHKFSRGWCAAALAIFVLTATDAIPRAFLSLAALPLVYQLSLWQTASGRWTHFSRSWGNLSYAIYLLHLPLMKLILFLLLVTGITSSQLFHALWELKMAYIGGTLLIVLGCSLLSYYFLERPARNAVRRALLKA